MRHAAVPRAQSLGVSAPKTSGQIPIEAKTPPTITPNDLSCLFSVCTKGLITIHSIKLELGLPLGIFFALGLIVFC